MLGCVAVFDMAVRRLMPLVMFVLAACGGVESVPATAVVGPATVAGPLTQVDDAVVVPEFTLTLADGSVFDSERVDTPVYLMFWAEW